MEQYGIRKITTGGRIAHFVLGTSLVTSVFAGSGPLGLAALLPLAGTYPMLIAILGIEPVQTLAGRGGEGRGTTPYLGSRPAHT